MKTNKEIALAFVDAAFVKRDPDALRPLVAPEYRQHNPNFPSGAEAILKAIAHLSPALVYEVGLVAAEGDIVMIHGRFSNWRPEPFLAVDIFRIENGRVVEHWDVVQTEVPAEKTASGNPMFSGA